MPSSSFLSPLSISRTPPARSPPPVDVSFGPSAPVRVLRIAFHVKHGELMRVICWPRARLRVLRSSRYNLKPARYVVGARIHRTLRNRRADPYDCTSLPCFFPPIFFSLHSALLSPLLFSFAKIILYFLLIRRKLF